MICYKNPLPEPPEHWVEDVQFVAATEEEQDRGLLGWVTCLLWGDVRLAPMRVSLHQGTMHIKVPRSGKDLAGHSVSFDICDRIDIQIAVEEDDGFQSALRAIGIRKGDEQP